MLSIRLDHHLHRYEAHLLSLEVRISFWVALNMLMQIPLLGVVIDAAIPEAWV